MKYLILLMLLGCATPIPCSKRSNYVERERCYENEKRFRHWHDSGWRYTRTKRSIW